MAAVDDWKDYYSYYLGVTVSTIPVAGASAVACATVLFAQVYFKMYRHFTYRLVLYTLVMTTLTSIFLIATMAMDIHRHVGSHEQPAKEHADDALYEIILYAANSIFISMWFSTSCISFSIYNMVVHNHLFKSWVSDLNCLLLSLVTPLVMLSLLAVACNGDKEVARALECARMDNSPFKSPLVFLVTAMLYVAINGVFLVTSIVFMCCRASDCNTITWAAATTASHRQALKETVALLLIPASTLIYIVFESCTFITWHAYSSTPYVAQLSYFVDNFIPGTLGLIISLLFAIHLCLLGKEKLKKLRGVKKQQVVQYGTMENRPPVFTTEGLSETCNTTYPHVSEDEVDRQFLQLPKANAVQ